MSRSTLTFRMTRPDAQAFIDLRAACGWGTLSKQTAEAALNASLLDVTCYQGPQLVGMGRVVGDGVLYFYLQDIVVTPDQRGRAIGATIVTKLLDRVRMMAAPGATIGLMSAHGKEGFYRRFGFQVRPSEALGAGMTQVIP